MWTDVLEKLNHLKSIDRQYQAFGARTHHYGLRRRLSSRGIKNVEDRLGVFLPDDLRCFYMQVGNGIAGPGYGLKPVAELTGYRPAEDYPGIEFIRQCAAAEGCGPDETGYFEAPHEVLAGLVAIIEKGCGHEICLISTGSGIGNVVYVNNDGFVIETDKTLIDIYLEWLNREIECFEAVRALMLSGKNREQIYKEMVVRHQDYSSNDRIVSIANVAKPIHLFGSHGHEIHHGAKQFPWYESVLREWQRVNM